MALLRGFVDQPSPVGDAFIDKLLRFSSFGDPRVLPLSEYWRELQDRDKSLFRDFSALLVKEDLTLFFQHAMRAKDREDFWLRYLPKIGRTIPVLSKATRKELARLLKGTEGGRAVLERTRVAQRGDVSAFCLVFDQVVVVEFSETGNAAYFYPRHVFDRDVFPEHKEFRDATALKRTNVQHDRLLHGSNWQSKAIELLRQYGVGWPEET